MLWPKLCNTNGISQVLACPLLRVFSTCISQACFAGSRAMALHGEPPGRHAKFGCPVGALQNVHRGLLGTGVRIWGVLQSRKPGYYAFYCILLLELKLVWRMPQSHLPGAAFCTKLALPVVVGQGRDQARAGQVCEEPSIHQYTTFSGMLVMVYEDIATIRNPNALRILICSMKLLHFSHLEVILSN